MKAAVLFALVLGPQASHQRPEGLPGGPGLGSPLQEVCQGEGGPGRHEGDEQTTVLEGLIIIRWARG